MKAQLLFHIKSLVVQASSRVGCTRQLLNGDEGTLKAVIPHERDCGVLHWLGHVHRQQCVDIIRSPPLPPSGAMDTYCDCAENSLTLVRAAVSPPFLPLNIILE